MYTNPSSSSLLLTSTLRIIRSSSPPYIHPSSSLSSTPNMRIIRSSSPPYIPPSTVIHLHPPLLIHNQFPNLKANPPLGRLSRSHPGQCRGGQGPGNRLRTQKELHVEFLADLRFSANSHKVKIKINCRSNRRDI